MVQSSSQHLFARIPEIRTPRSTFDRSHGWKGTFDEGYLIPFYADEALPGDSVNLRVQAFMRFATPIFPVMDNMYVTTFFFFVPLRLIWNNSEKFFGFQEDPNDTTDYVTPKLTIPGGGLAVGTIYDYMGVPTGVVPNKPIHNFHGRAHNLIYNYWFRDQNLQDSIVVDKDDGPDDPADYILRRRGKRHDYFTSGLPWPQKGPEVEIPLTGNAPITGIGVGTGVSTSASTTLWETDASSGIAVPTFSSGLLIRGAQASAGVGASNTPQIFADMNDVSGIAINTLREAITMQQYYELNARGGTRYPEFVLSHFGVRTDDARMQFPEYIGGSTSYMQINPIAQTSESNTTPQGNLAAMGTVSFNHGFTKSFVEHGVILGFVCAHADLNYQQGVNRMFTRSTVFDFYDPVFANLGEQPILNQEIYVSGSSTDTEAFAYQERWAEYRYFPNITTSLFRSQAAGTLDAWHWAQEFGSLPVLNDTFIQENAPVDRTIAVETEPHFIADCMFKMKTARVMPVYSVPGLQRL